MTGRSLLAGFSNMVSAAPERFDMIHDRNHEYYKYLPGTGHVFNVSSNIVIGILSMIYAIFW